MGNAAKTGKEKEMNLSSLYRLNQEDLFFINETRSYYPNQFIGRIFENKLTKTVYNFEKYLFNRLNLNLLWIMVLILLLKRIFSFWQKQQN